MNAIAQPLRLAAVSNGTAASRKPTNTTLCCDCVVLETAADQSWTDFCKTLSKPAFLLADVFSDDSE